MGLRKSASAPVRKITKVGGSSYAITIPMDFIKDLGWRERQKVVVKQEGKRLIIEDWEE